VWIGFGGYPEKRVQENAGYVLPAGVRYCIHNKSKWKMAKFHITSMNPHEGFDEYPTVRGLQVLDPNAPESDSEDEPPPKRKKKKAPKSKSKSKKKTTKKSKAGKQKKRKSESFSLKS